MARLGLACAALGAALCVVPFAHAGPQEDFNAVYADWQPDGDVTACRFTRQQLVNARNVAAGAGDFTYDQRFSNEVSVEINRIDAGGCPAGATGGAGSPLTALRIARIRPRGGPGRESVTIRNAGRRSTSLRGASLRDRSGNRIRFRRSVRLRARRSLRVVTGCARGRRRAVRRGSRFFACKRRQLWNDRGDVVKLVDSRRRVVAQRGYGRYRRVPRF